MAVPMHGSPQGQAEDPSRVCRVYHSVIPESCRRKLWPPLLIIPAWVEFSQVARATVPIRTLFDGRLAAAFGLKDWLLQRSLLKALDCLARSHLAATFCSNASRSLPSHCCASRALFCSSTCSAAQLCDRPVHAGLKYL